MMGEEKVSERAVRTNVGGLVHLMMERRPLLGLLEKVFRATERIEGSGHLRGEEEDEILAGVTGLPLAISDLRAPIDPTVGVTDA